MKFDSCTMKKVADEAAVRAGKPGSFCIVDIEEHGAKFRRLWAHFPDGTVGAFALEPAPAEAIPWPWNKNEKKPTLHRRVKLTGRWHGRVLAGRIVSDPAPPELPQTSAVSGPPVVTPAPTKPKKKSRRR